MTWRPGPELPWPESQPHRGPDLVAMLLKPDWVTDNDRLATDWWTFHLRHISVGRRLHSMTLELIDAGHGHLSIGMLWEVLRHETMLGDHIRAFPNLPQEFRLNNNHRALYARWLMDLDPRLAGVFELRARNVPTPEPAPPDPRPGRRWGHL